MLELKPWELMRLQPMEFYKLVKGYEARKKINDQNSAFWVSSIMNTQFAKGKGVSVDDFMKILHPPTEAEKKQAEIDFINEFRAEGGEI